MGCDLVREALPILPSGDSGTTPCGGALLSDDDDYPFYASKICPLHRLFCKAATDICSLRDLSLGVEGNI
jgi:hypothetical protein